MRSAISPESAAFELSRLESAGRETCSALAAAVTVKPEGSMIAVVGSSWKSLFSILLTKLAILSDLSVVSCATLVGDT